MPTTSWKTRIKMKYDTYENWAKATTFVPLKGELILVKNSNNTVSIYIGDGTSVWSSCKCLNTVLQSRLAGKTLITAVSKSAESASSTSTVTDNGHSHNYTKTTGASFAGNAHNHTITDNGHAHSYSKTTSASFTGSSGTTSNSATGITATASAPSFTGSSHTHSVTDNKHAHGYDKVTSASFSGSPGTTSGSGTGITASATASSVSIGDHAHSVTDNGHTHGYDKVTSASFKGSSGTTGSSSTGISAELKEAPTFTGNYHTHSYNTFKITYEKDEGALKILSSTATTTSEKPTGTISAPDIIITDSGHTHSFTPSGSIDLVYNSGSATQTSTAKSAASIVINNASLSGTAAAQKITINDPGHSHGFTPGGSINLTYNKGETTQTSTSSNTSNLSINAATQGGSVSAPVITISDKGHTHGFTPAGSIGLSYTATSTTSSATGLTLANAIASGTISLSNEATSTTSSTTGVKVSTNTSISGGTLSTSSVYVGE